MKVFVADKPRDVETAVARKYMNNPDDNAESN